MNGKGDRYRPVDWARWRKNYDSIFRKCLRERKKQNGTKRDDKDMQ